MSGGHWDYMSSVTAEGPDEPSAVALALYRALAERGG